MFGNSKYEISVTSKSYGSGQIKSQTQFGIVRFLCFYIDTCKQRKIENFVITVSQSDDEETKTNTEIFAKQLDVQMKINSRKSTEGYVLEMSQILNSSSGIKTVIFKCFVTEIFDEPQVITHGFYSGCSVCLEQFKDGESVKELPCRHLYHPTCIEKWLPGHGNCPTCRKDV